MNELDYEKIKDMRKDEFDKYIKNMTDEQIKSALVDKKILTFLINEDFVPGASNYPLIHSLIAGAQSRNISDEIYYIEFINGFVAQTFLQRKADKKNDENYIRYNSFEDKKIELLSLLPENIGWVLGTKDYIDLLVGLDRDTIFSICHNVSLDGAESIYNGLLHELQALNDKKGEEEFGKGTVVNGVENSINNIEQDIEIVLKSIQGKILDKGYRRQLSAEKIDKITRINNTRVEYKGMLERKEGLERNLHEKKLQLDSIKRSMNREKNNEKAFQDLYDEAYLLEKQIKDMEYSIYDLDKEINLELLNPKIENKHPYYPQKELQDENAVLLAEGLANGTITEETRNLLNESAKLLAEGLANDNIIARAEEILDINNGVTPIEQTTSILSPEAALSKELADKGVTIDGTRPKEEMPVTEEILDINNGVTPIEQTTSILSPEAALSKELADKGVTIDENTTVVSTPVVEERKTIDQTLESYTTVENTINQNPNLTEEQKKQMRDVLWSDFDKYVEQNPEQTKQR